MTIVLLSGGSGSKLWPLSNEVRSKQFLKVFKKQDGTYESMLQRVYNQITKTIPNADVIIATSHAQAAIIRNQLGDKVELSIEPKRANTFPAIALAAAYVRDVKGRGENETLIVCPVDCYTQDPFFCLFYELERMIDQDETDLGLIGVRALFAEDTYGYMIPADPEEECSEVSCFVEKPTIAKAEELIGEGAYWNCGVYCCRVSDTIEKVNEYMHFSDFDELYQRYDELPCQSFDKVVVEKEKRMRMIRFDGQWNDLGTWKTLSEFSDYDAFGEVHADSSVRNTYVFNELGIPLLVAGANDLVVAAASDGILVANRNCVSNIKPLVEGIDRMVRYLEKSWGTFRIIDVTDNGITAKVTVKSGMRMSYHSHKYRDEMWVVIEGNGHTIVDGMEQTVKPGDVVTMQAGCRHTVIANTDLEMIEVQLGKEISVYDKKKYALGS